MARRRPASRPEEIPPLDVAFNDLVRGFAESRKAEAELIESMRSLLPKETVDAILAGTFTPTALPAPPATPAVPAAAPVRGKDVRGDGETLLGDDVVAVLAASTVTRHMVVWWVQLPPGQLERSLYQRVNAVLETLGGKWDRTAPAHIFAEDPTERLQTVVREKRVVLDRDLGFFPTSPTLAERVVKLADIRPGHRVLEPSAGDGALVNEVWRQVKVFTDEIQCVELDERRAAALEDQGYRVLREDFLTLDPRRFQYFDRVVMNPPFAKQADIDHVRHAYRFLGPGGRLVAIMASGVMTREGKAQEFRNWAIDTAGGWFEGVEDGAFSESGTMVRTCLVVLFKPYAHCPRCPREFAHAGRCVRLQSVRAGRL